MSPQVDGVIVVSSPASTNSKRQQQAAACMGPAHGALSVRTMHGLQKTPNPTLRQDLKIPP
jgi:4-hydroxy-3-methylbut-2-enyl diphosphate reductase IspH